MFSLKQTLEKQLQKEQPNIKEITEKMVTQELTVIQEKNSKVVDQLNKDLHNRIEKVLKLEQELDEVREAYKHLEASMSKEDLHFKQKSQNLERNLE